MQLFALGKRLTPYMKAIKLLLIGGTCALTLLGTLGVVAQDQNSDTPPPPPDEGGPHFRHGPPPKPPGVSQADWDKLHKAIRQVLDSDKDLQAEDETLHKEGRAAHEQGTMPTEDQVKAFFEKMKAHEEKVKAAVLKVDPSLAPVFAAMDKDRAEHAQNGCPPPPPSSDQD